VTLLERHFPDLVDYAFTARMEDDLDDIAGGEMDAIPWLSASTSVPTSRFRA
jgi:DNA topoisomerase I